MFGGIKVPSFYLMLLLNIIFYKVVAGGWTHMENGAEEFKFVRPYRSTESGKFISYDIFPISGNRQYPDEKETPDITSGMETHAVQYLTITTNDDLLIMNITWDSKMIAEVFADIDDDNKIPEGSQINRECLLVGSVVGDPDSRVVIKCEGVLNGWICGTDFDYYLQGNTNAGLYNLYRVDKSSTWRTTNVTAAVPRSVCRHQRSSRDKRSIVDQKFTIEMAMLVDYSIQTFYGDGTEDYLLTVMSLAADSFRHPSFEYNVDIVINKINYLDQNTSSLMIDPSSPTRSRRNVGQYMYGLNNLNDANPDHFDAGVYITRNNFGPKGYAKTGGMCNLQENTVLVKDEGYKSAYVIAHEIGHLLNMEHDGDGNACQRDISKLSIMSSEVRSTYNEHTWSECSIDKFEEFVTSPGAWCLKDEPFNDKVYHLESNPYPGVGVSMDEQCKGLFDSSFVRCNTFFPDNILCNSLWCMNKDKPFACNQKESPSLDGTSCGKNKWCIKGKCEKAPKLAKTNVVNGGWTDWGDFSECSLTCGVGISSRSRTCTNPKPKNGGKYCEGENMEHKACNVQPCPGVKTDIRAEKCEEQNQVLIPAEPENESERCLLTCVSKNSLSGKVVKPSMEPVLDGIPCSYDNPSFICINGECTQLGCDNVIGSLAKVDSCGVCQGTNATCSTTKKTFKKTMKKNAYVITTIPAGARHIEVVEKTGSGHFLVLRNVDTGENVIDTRSSAWQTSERSVISTGVKFTFNIKEDGRRVISSSPGPILNKLSLKIYRKKTDSTMPSIKCVFITEREEEMAVLPEVQFAMAGSSPHVDVISTLPEPQYDWVVDGVSECSATCGGGLQTEIYKCKRTDDMTVVDKRKCKTEAPNSKKLCAEQACRTYSWDVSAWSDCSKTCGEGERTRSVKCIRSVNGQTKTMKAKQCTSPRPETIKTCSNSPC